MNTTTNETQAATLLEMEAMLDSCMDNIQEAAGFANPPSGQYSLEIASCKAEDFLKSKGTSEETKAWRIRVMYKVAETYSVTGSALPVPDGTLFSCRYDGTAEGLGKFKKDIKKMVDDHTVLQGVDVKTAMGRIVGSTFDAVVTATKILKDPKYTEGGYWENVYVRPIPKVEGGASAGGMPELAF
jgi:hypothetical protein